MTDYTLTAAAGVLALLGGGTDGASRADAGAFAVSGGEVRLTRAFVADVGDLTVKLDRLARQTAYFNKDGTPTAQFQLLWQRHCEAIELGFKKQADAILAIQAAYNAAAQASAAASAASNAAAEVRQEVSGIVETVTAIEDGTFNFPAITVGGEKFVNAGGAEGLKPSEAIL